jgi:glutamate 5-kinase
MIAFGARSKVGTGGMESKVRIFIFKKTDDLNDFVLG